MNAYDKEYLKRLLKEFIHELPKRPDGKIAGEPLVELFKEVGVTVEALQIGIYGTHIVIDDKK